MSVLDFGNLTQWQIAMGENKHNRFPGDTICKEQLHREIKFSVSTCCFHILKSTEPRWPTPVEEQILES